MMIKKIVPTVTVLLVFCMVLSACNLPTSGTTPDTQGAEQTSIASTVSVMKTALATAATPAAPVVVESTATNTPETIPPTATLTFTPEPTFTSTIPPATATNTATPQPTYKLGNVLDINYPDNTVVAPGASFTKTWRVTNTGTGTWNSNFKIVFVSGDAMSGPASKAIGKSVAPGETIELSVALVAPATAKTYQGNWIMQTDTGTNFGLGANADGSFWVKVKVDQPFKITKAVVVPSPSTYTGACPVYLVFVGKITATSAGTATYYFDTSITKSKTYTLGFSGAETVTTGTYTVVVPTTQVVTAFIYDVTPNNQAFGSTSVSVTCVP